MPGIDFSVLWEAGRMVLTAIDPYTVPELSPLGDS
jgi:hypothetical protein